MVIPRNTIRRLWCGSRLSGGDYLVGFLGRDLRGESCSLSWSYLSLVSALLWVCDLLFGWGSEFVVMNLGRLER